MTGLIRRDLELELHPGVGMDEPQFFIESQGLRAAFVSGQLDHPDKGGQVAIGCITKFHG